MGGKKAESCGRCAMSSTTSVMDDPPDPYEGERIEIAEEDARAVSPAAWLTGLKERVDAWATRVTYGR
jgi:hypothetical protein